MLLGCGGFLVVFLMIFGGMFYEEMARHFGARIAWVGVVVAALVLLGVVARLITTQAKAEDS